jgi:hypothetical protein
MSSETREWQPFNTAHKNGIAILAFRPDPEGVFSPITGIDLIWWEPSISDWTKDGDSPYHPLNPFTHWMPLPEPPK